MTKEEIRALQKAGKLKGIKGIEDFLDSDVETEESDSDGEGKKKKKKKNKNGDDVFRLEKLIDHKCTS